MLLRMYLRWAERHRFKTDVVDSQEGEQAGIKSATVTVDGRFAYGWLRAERGVHRLVRISPYDAQKRRQTTFALVEVMPEADEDVEIELNWDEIRVDTFRSSGAGGQHVQKTESAIRLTHLPTGIVVTCQNERSATQNRELAIRVLKSRLLELELEKREEELRKLRGEHVTAGWGNQIRSYVLHPYQMVKDLRSGYETSNTGAVLDGDLDAFMQAELERVATGRPAVAPTPTPTRTSSRAAARRRQVPAWDRATDLDGCMRIWRAGIEDYQGRLNQPAMPDDLAPLRRLLRTCWRRIRTGSGSRNAATAPPAPPDGRPRRVRQRLACARACGSSRCCSCDPAMQADGIGQALMDRDPGRA